MSKTDTIPKGYSIEHYKSPTETRVYRDQQTCKCCGHNSGRMVSIKTFNSNDSEKNRQDAIDWLNQHIREEEYARMSPEEQRTKCCD